MNNTGPLFESKSAPKKKKGASIIAEIFIFAFICGLVYFTFFLNNSSKKQEEVTTTTTESTTISTSSTASTVKKTIPKFTTKEKTTNTATTKPKQYTLSGIINDIKNGYNYYSLSILENLGFKLIDPPQTGLRMSVASTKYYQEMLDGAEETGNNLFISSRVTIKHYPSRTIITTRSKVKEYSVNNVIRIKAFVYPGKTEWFDIYLLTKNEVYRFAFRDTATLTKISSVGYDDIVVHPKGLKSIFYYVKETEVNKKKVYTYTNTSTNKVETHDEINDAYDNGSIKIKTNKDLYYNGISQNFRYGFTFIDKNNINRIIIATDSTVYEYFYDQNTKTSSYRKLKDTKASKYLVYDRGNNNNYLIILFKDNTEIVRENYYLKELPYDLT